MLIFVLYDISDNLSRSNFIKKLRFYGLKRIQKSVFSGFLNIEERLDLINEFDLFLSSENDSIVLIPICESCRKSISFEGNLKLPKKEKYIFL